MCHCTEYTNLSVLGARYEEEGGMIRDAVVSMARGPWAAARVQTIATADTRIVGEICINNRIEEP